MRKKYKDVEAKYFIFANAIDLLAHKAVVSVYYNVGDVFMTFNELKAGIKELPHSKILDGYSDEQVNLWISELSWLDITERVSEREVNSVMRLTPAGLDAYKKQTFQSIYANLVEAEFARKLSVVTIIIASLSFVVAIVTLIFSTIC